MRTKYPCEMPKSNAVPLYHQVSAPEMEKIKAKLDTAQKECIRIARIAEKLQQENSQLKRIFRNIENRIEQFKKQMEEK